MIILCYRSSRPTPRPTKSPTKAPTTLSSLCTKDFYEKSSAALNGSTAAKVAASSTCKAYWALAQRKRRKRDEEQEHQKLKCKCLAMLAPAATKHKHLLCRLDAFSRATAVAYISVCKSRNAAQSTTLARSSQNPAERKFADCVKRQFASKGGYTHNSTANCGKQELKGLSSREARLRQYAALRLLHGEKMRNCTAAALKAAGSGKRLSAEAYKKCRAAADADYKKAAGVRKTSELAMVAKRDKEHQAATHMIQCFGRDRRNATACFTQLRGALANSTGKTYSKVQLAVLLQASARREALGAAERCRAAAKKAANQTRGEVHRQCQKEAAAMFAFVTGRASVDPDVAEEESRSSAKEAAGDALRECRQDNGTDCRQEAKAAYNDALGRNASETQVQRALDEAGTQAVRAVCAGRTRTQCLKAAREELARLSLAGSKGLAKVDTSGVVQDVRKAAASEAGATFRSCYAEAESKGQATRHKCKKEAAAAAKGVATKELTGLDSTQLE